MRLGIIVNTNDPETAWNALRLGSEALSTGNEVNLFLLGAGVEIENIKDEAFNVAAALTSFSEDGGKLMACGTCLSLRDRGAGVCPISTMSELVKMISDSDKVVTLG
ncbi:MAG: DsrE family protein [Dehalococcoidia bacterium]